MKTTDSRRAPAGRITNARAHSSPAPTDEALAGTAEVVLLSTDGADFRRVGVDAAEGVLTLHGKVSTHSEKLEAAAAVRKVDGVHDVQNQLEVVADTWPPARSIVPPRGSRRPGLVGVVPTDRQ